MGILSMPTLYKEEEEVDVSSRPTDWDEIDAIFGLQKESIDGDVAVIVLKVHNPNFCENKKSFDYRICGKTLSEWVCLAFADCPLLEIEVEEDDDLLSVIKPHISDKKYTAVFYADTPLLTRKTFLGIINYVKNKRMNVCKLERGFVFVTEYLRTAERLYSSTSTNLEIGDDLKCVDSFDSFAFVADKLKKRVLGYHISRGVEILDLENVSIDADVVIGKNSIVHPGVNLLGRTSIGENVTLYPNTTIISSSIGNNCQIVQSLIQYSKIRDNSTIEPFSFVLNGEIKLR